MRDAMLDYIKPGMRVLDMGTGSGILAFAAAERGAAVTATDINPAALEHAKEQTNLQINFIESDLFQKIRGKFDLIVFNPPYLPTSKVGRTGDLIEKAWDGGDTGREVLDRFLEQCKSYLAPSGKILFVQSNLTGKKQTEKKLKSLGLKYTIVATKELPFFEILEAYLCELP